MKIDTKHISALLDKKMEHIGFKKNKTEYIFQVQGGISAVVMVGISEKFSPKKKKFTLTPVIGVRNAEVENLVEKILGYKPHNFATASVFLGYVCPEKSFKEWNVDETSVNESITEITNYIVAYGMPFVKSLAPLRETETILAKQENHNPEALAAKIAIKLILGEKKEAIALAGNDSSLRNVSLVIQNRG